METQPVLGAFKSPYDPRRINMTQVFAPTAISSTVPIIDQAMLDFPIQNQEVLGICVAETICRLMELYIFRTQNKAVKLSRRFMYWQCKQKDGLAGQGTYIPTGAMVAVNIGCCTEDLCPTDTTMSYEAFMDLTVTEPMMSQAYLLKMPGVVFINPDLNSIRQAIASYHEIGLGIEVGNMDNHTIYPPGASQPMIGSHALPVYGSVPEAVSGVQDVVKLFQNSWGSQWGNNGYGALIWSQFNNYIFDVIAFTDIPQSILSKVQGMNTNIVNLNEWCLAAQSFEGWWPGSTSFTNNNPGNLKYVGQALATGADKSGFCIFPTYQDGYATLYQMIYNACAGKSQIYHPDMTLAEFYLKYTSDGALVSANYAKAVVAKIGCTVDTKIGTLIS